MGASRGDPQFGRNGKAAGARSGNIFPIGPRTDRQPFSEPGARPTAVEHYRLFEWRSTPHAYSRRTKRLWIVVGRPYRWDNHVSGIRSSANGAFPMTIRRSSTRPLPHPPVGKMARSLSAACRSTRTWCDARSPTTQYARQENRLDIDFASVLLSFDPNTHGARLVKA